MATLFNTKIKDTYQSLLKLEDNTILTTIVKNVTDGLGNASPLYMSTTRIGIGTNAPAYTLDAQGTAASQIRVKSTTAGAYIDYSNSSGSTYSFGAYLDGFITVFGGTVTSLLKSDGTNTFGNSLTSLGARVGIKGSGSTSATTSLLVQNSGGTRLLQVSDDGRLDIGTTTSGLGAIYVPRSSTYGVRAFLYNQDNNPMMKTISNDEMGVYLNCYFDRAVGIAGNFTTALTMTTSLSGANSTSSLIRNSGTAWSTQSNGTCIGIDLQPIIDTDASSASAKYIGFYWNPNIADLQSAKHNAIETVTGNVLLGTTSGFVGIGTSNPTNKLEVIGAARISSTLNVGGDSSVGSSYSSGFIAYDTGNGYAHSLIHAQAASLYLFANPQGFAIAGYEPASSGLSASNLAFMTSSSTRMKILSNGNVLIGTTTDAGYKLDVNGTVRIQNTLRLNSNFEIASSAVICGISRVPGNGPGMIFTENMQSGQIPFQFASGYNSPATKGFLNSGGRSILNINIGLGSPNADNLDASVLLLDGIHNVTSATGTTIRGIYYNPTITSLTGVVAHRAIETTSGDIVFNGGNVLIGTSTNSSYKLDVNGSTRVKANSLTISASGLTSPVPSNYVALNFDDAPNHHERWFSINSVKDLNGYVAGLGTSYDRIIFPVKGSGHSAWQFDAYGTSSEIQISARNSTTGNYLSLTNSSINFCGPWTVASIDRTNRKLVFGDMSTDVHHLAAYDIVIKGSKPFEANSGGYPNGGNVYVVGGTPSTSPAGNYGNVILAHDGTTARGAVVVGGTTAAASAIVDVQSTTKGVLFPRMTNAQRGLIASPAIGLLVYCTDAVEGLYIYKSTGWTFIA